MCVGLLSVVRRAWVSLIKVIYCVSVSHAWCHALHQVPGYVEYVSLLSGLLFFWVSWSLFLSRGVWSRVTHAEEHKFLIAD